MDITITHNTFTGRYTLSAAGTNIPNQVYSNYRLAVRAKTRLMSKVQRIKRVQFNVSKPLI